MIDRISLKHGAAARFRDTAGCRIIRPVNVLCQQLSRHKLAVCKSGGLARVGEWTGRFPLKRFLTWLRGFRTVPDQAAVERPAPINDDQIARRVIERLSEDESLRGDLTDDAFKPIFDWVTSLVPVAARRAAPEPDPDEAGEELSQAARQLLRALAQVVASGDTS